MFDLGGFIFLVVLIAALINECPACFRSNATRQQVLQVGLPFFQECQCEEAGYTINDLKWLDIHDQPIETGPGMYNDPYTEEAPDKISLFIPKISKSTSGNYKCVTEVDGNKYVQTYTVDAYEPLYFFHTPNDQHLVLEKDSKIVCEARGDTLPRITWMKQVDGEFSEIPFDTKYEIIPEGILIRNASLEDAGKFKCTAFVMSTGEEVDVYIDVDVQTIPIIQEIRGYPDSRVIANRSLSIECIAEGGPTPQYAWKKIGTDNNNNTWTQNVNTISFDSIQPEDEGSYECTAYNEAGYSKGLINIEVLVAPLVTRFENITDVEKTMIQIICNATGKPEPNITITFEGWDVESGWELSTYEELPNKVLIDLNTSNEGIYVCNATNEVGSDISSMYLTVLHKPYFKEQNNGLVVWGYEGKVVKLSCAQYSNPRAFITWRFESNAIPTEDLVEINKSLQDVREDYLTLIDSNATFGMYICTATNRYGEALKTITLKKGFKPSEIETPINITDIKATSVTFNIEGPFSNDAPEIRGYTAQYDEESNYDITNIHLNRTWSVDRPYKIQKLKPNTTYFVSFAAINEVGVGNFSKQLNFTTVDKSVPESPLLEEASIETTPSGKRVFKWKETSDNGEPIDYYVLKYCPVYDELDEKLCEVLNVTQPPELDLADLETNITYFMELIAHNAKGNSTPTNISIVFPVIENGEPATLLSGGAIIGISIIIVIVCLILLDLLLLAWRRQGVIAACCMSKAKNKKEDTLNSRDKKGLLIVEPVDTRPESGHRKFEYDKETGVITGKHSAV